MTTFYIATSLSRAPEHNQLRDALVNRGYRITYDWTVHGSVKTSSLTRLEEVAHYEARGVLSADIVIVLLPGGFGTHAELGMAIGAQKKIILHSEDGEIFTACEKTCAFYHHRNASQLVCELSDTEKFSQTITKLISDTSSLSTIFSEQKHHSLTA